MTHEEPLEGGEIQPTGGFSYGERMTRAIEGLVNKVGDGGNKITGKIDEGFSNLTIDEFGEHFSGAVESATNAFGDRADKYVATQLSKFETGVDDFSERLGDRVGVEKLVRFFSISIMESEDFSEKVALSLAVMPLPVQEQFRALLPSGWSSPLGLAALAFIFYFGAISLSSAEKGDTYSFATPETSGFDAEPAMEIVELIKEIEKKVSKNGKS